MFFEPTPRFRAWLDAFAGTRPELHDRLEDEAQWLRDNLAASERERAARIEESRELRRSLEVSERDREARIRALARLDGMLAESKRARQIQGDEIQRLRHSLEETEQRRLELESRLEATEHSNRLLEAGLSEIRSSSSWRITYPLRLLGSPFARRVAEVRHAESSDTGPRFPRAEAQRSSAKGAPPIRVAVNVRTLSPGTVGGLETAFREIFDRLIRHHADELEVTLLTSSHNHQSFADWNGLVDYLRLPDEMAPTAWASRLSAFDLFFCPLMFLDPAEPPIPSVVMIPDLQHETHPEFFTAELLLLRRVELRTRALRTRRILTISEFSRQEILRSFELPAERVAAVCLDSSPEFLRPKDPEGLQRLVARLELPPRWLLFPAINWPHKNHRLLFRALALYRRRFGAPPMLLLTGARIDAVDLEAAARAEGVADLVRDLGWMESTEMPHLYDGASCLLFVSLFEGFGIPLVEAMRRGTPVVASNRGSIPEVAGDAALLVDPTDPEAIATALHEVLSNPAAATARAELARARADRFSYDRAAARTLEVLREALAEPQPRFSRLTLESPPRVFVVTPSFQQAPFLRATIDSVLAQDYPRIDYLVADGGSTDGSAEILHSYGDRLHWRSGPDGGQAAAIANAWRETDAEIVAWLNSDDTYLPGAVSRAVEHLVKTPGAAMVYGKSWQIDAQGKRLEPYRTQPFDAAMLRHDCFISQPATFLRRELFGAIDFPNPGLRFCMDYDLWIRISRQFEISYLDDFLACSRVYADTKSLRERDAVYDEIIRVTERHFGVAYRNWVVGQILHRCETKVGRLSPLGRFLPLGVRNRLMARLALRLESGHQLPPYSDGWAGTETLVDVQPDALGRVKLLADSPFWPRGRALHIAVEHDGVRLLNRAIRARGPFTLEFDLPAAARKAGRAARVVLRANRTFVPFVEGFIATDPRPVSFRIQE